MASRLLAAAVAELANDESHDTDWLIGGDANASLESGDLNDLLGAGLVPLTAKDAADNQITYIKAPFKSLIDHLFLSPNLVPSDDDFMIIALDRTMERFWRYRTTGRSLSGFRVDRRLNSWIPRLLPSSPTTSVLVFGEG
ncbi:hypothetical protein NKK52_31725 [Mesorhizobium sp. C277A]|uniref:endonuclease/exonuclease/phosphatase family protein n=1 Tax=unclassified Mesorhizobium TaxID=325217 RepID=UPI0003CF05F6|nr:endonuclease/exonuclease/phosphatase family protein [Mesorhizobium sp. LSJC277A00]ESW62871.1 hypothetical protein X771_32140 [Mesorhizobium sp. LSJC277A00]